MSLEGNHIIDEDNWKPFKDFTEVLKNNQWMIYLNLSNIKLNPSALEDLISLLEINHTLIMIDISDNEGLNYKRVRYL